MKIKENKKREFAGGLKKLRDMRIMVIAIVTDAFGTIPKDLVRGLVEMEIRGRAETIQTTVLLGSARIL